MENRFSKLITKQEAVLKKDNNAFSRVGYGKLILLLAFGICLYFTFIGDNLREFVLADIVLLLAQIVLWVHQGRLQQRIDFSKGIIASNSRNIDRLTGKWIDFSDVGREFIDPDHPYGSDLDVVGKKSLFQFLNTTGTWHGRQAFAGDLLAPNYTKHELLQRQEAIRELSKDIEFANLLEYHLAKIGLDPDAPGLVEDLKDNSSFMGNKAAKLFLTYVPYVTFPFIVCIVILQLHALYPIGIIIALAQTIIWLIGLPKAAKYLGVVIRLPYKLHAYSTVIALLKDRTFSSEKLRQIQADLSTADCSAAEAIKELSKISDKTDIKHNGIIYFLANVFLLWDYNCALLLEKWKARYSPFCENWFVVLGEFESLLCLSKLTNVCDRTCLPSVEEGTKQTIKAAQMGHPLLPNEVRVNNDFICNNAIHIISGSNMSGKTTFLRTVGINLVLAHTGGFVCAAEMLFTPQKIMTSMRIADDLNEGISTFYAELKRIKGIIEMAQKEPNMIFLIDEMFRGTNSIDRLSGAKTVIAKLDELGVAGIITTHDLELCALERQHVRLQNYSFFEHYVDDKICFDYKIKPGKSNTTNAKYLMKLVGII